MGGDAVAVDRRPRLWRAITAVVIGLMVAPVVVDRDSHPLSTYPMYSSARGREVTIPVALAITTAGVEERLGLQTVGGSDDPLIVAGELRAAIREGRADERCLEIAGRVDPATYGSIVVVMERHDVVEQVRGEPSLIERTVHATCRTERP